MRSLPALWICGDTLVELRDLEDADGSGEPLWRWDSRDAPGLDAAQRAWFRSMDEVKPVTWQGEPCVLVCASGSGGVALVRRADRALLFARPLANAHSAELLADGWIAMAGSDGSDRLELARIGSREEPIAHPLPHGHGAVADGDEGRFWTSEWEHVRAFRWRDGRLSEELAVRLPDTGAHDLMPDPRSGGLVVCTDAGVWHLDRETLAVSPFVPLMGQAKVKSVSIDAASGAWCHVQGEGTRWWSEEVRIIGPDGSHRVCRLPGRKLYKARWDRRCRIGVED